VSDQAGPRLRWLEISVEVDREAIDDVAVLFGRHCQGGAVVEDRPPDIAREPTQRATIKGYLAESDSETARKLEIALLLLSDSAPISEPRVRMLEPEDWADSWKAYFPVRHVGRSLVIVPTWQTYAPQPGERIIRLDPGMAFGTGLHPTTRLCLMAMERCLEPGWRVLDVGTGSGILAIAGALLGARSVDALDVDPVAVTVASANARLNGVSSLIRVTRATLGEVPDPEVRQHVETGYDLVVSNILAETISLMAPHLARAVRSGGVVIASGILSTKAEMVTQALSAHGLAVTDQLQEEDWVALVARLP